MATDIFALQVKRIKFLPVQGRDLLTYIYS